MIKKLGVVVAIAIMGVGAGDAATKCVALSASNTTCTYVYNNGNGSADYQWWETDWGATCTMGGVSTRIEGVGVCAGEYSNIQGETSDVLTSDDDNTYCWCKMISPVVSTWVFSVHSNPDETDCVYDCGYYCVRALKENSTFRAAMLGSVQ